MSLVRNPLMNPWKDASRIIGGQDSSVALYVKCIAEEGATSGTEVTDSDIAVSSDVITLRIDEDGGGLSADTGISYTGISGSNVITTSDSNANTIQEVINIINGVGVGQTAFARWRAWLGDVYPSYALTSGDIIDKSATKTSVGRYGTPVELNFDRSSLATEAIFCGIGTYRRGGAAEGAGVFFPDYFADIPGSSTTASVNTPVRSGALRSAKFESSIVAQKQVRITGWSFGGDWDTGQNVVIYDINGNVVHQEATTAGSAITFQDRSDVPIVGPVGSPLFFSVQGSSTFANGVLSVRAEERFT